MPELAEVEYYRRLWDPGLGHVVTGVRLHPKAAVFRGTSPTVLKRQLTGATLVSSEAAAKQMLFRLTPTETAPDANASPLWLGIHLGMTGELSLRSARLPAAKRDHLILDQHDRSLVFSDFRMFGRIQFHAGPDAPDWWTSIAPAILSDAFTVGAVTAFLRRRARTAIKPVLLMQERFPGVGNWMADEILWSAAIHPKRPSGSLTADEVKDLHRETRRVCREAIKFVGKELHGLPQSWLFHHRWENGGRCPKTGAPLIRETIGGRTTCWSPPRQKL